MRIQSDATNKEIPTAQALRESFVTMVPGHHGPDQREGAEDKPSSTVLSVETETTKTNGHSPISPLDRIVSICEQLHT